MPFVEALATAAAGALNPKPAKPARKTTMRNGKRGKTAGARYKEAWTGIGGRAMAVLALSVGNLVGNITRTQVVARLPIEQAGILQLIDLVGQNAVTAPLLAMIPGDFGYDMAVGVTLNTVQAGARAVIPETLKSGAWNPAVALFGVDSFRNSPQVDAENDQALVDAANGAGRMQAAGAARTVGGIQLPKAA